MRCLALADSLARAGATCTFICRAHPGHLGELLKARGHALRLLTSSTEVTDQESGHASWMGAAWEEDARQTLEQIDEMVDWLVVDHYSIDHRWEDAVRAGCRRLAVIDDLADRPHSCELLLDQNWHGSGAQSRYKELTPAHCVHLLGPQYALLGPEYAELKRWRPEHDGLVRRVLLFFGGSDPDNLTAKALAALSTPEFSTLVLDVVVGQNHPDPSGIAQMATARSGTVVHQNLPSLAGLMLRSDLMLGAGGSTNWERMCLGLPSIVISIADNQVAINRALSVDGYIDFLGPADGVSVDDIADAVSDAVNSPELLRTRSRIGRDLVGGDGAVTMTDVMMGSC